ncbi:hypothetical protein NHQ30_007689 [Ciborinia camelliae]|nr:hypothetical protein NHQ30_007689 [Ciborinia camelliae]
MSAQKNKCAFEIYKRRRIKVKSQPIVTHINPLKAMEPEMIAEPRKEMIQKYRKTLSTHSNDEDIQQRAVYPYQKYTYEQLLQKNRNFFMTVPLMRCSDGKKDIDEKLGNELLVRLREEVLRIQRPQRRNDKNLGDLEIQIAEIREFWANDNNRGEIQIRAFWANVRLQLQIDEEEEDINESRSRISFENFTDKEVKDYVKSKSQGFRPLELIKKVYMDVVG